MQEKSWFSTLASGLFVAAASLALAPAVAKWSRSETDEGSDREDRRRGWSWRRWVEATHREARELRLPASGSIRVDAAPNGAIRVEGSGRDDVLVRVEIVATGDTRAEARQVASEVTIDTGGGLRARGPVTGGELHWSASFHLQVPARSDLFLETDNGRLWVSGVDGTIEAETVNGDLRLERVAGNLRGRTANGKASITLDGSSWRGEGLDVASLNGNVSLRIPSGYSAHLEADSVHGSVTSTLALPSKSGRRGHGSRLVADLGDGGAPIRVASTNRAVKIRRAG